MTKHLFVGLLIIFAGLSAVNALEWGRHSCLPADRNVCRTRFTFSEPHMGTLFKIILYAPTEAAAKKAAQAAFARIAELDRIMSDYKSDSELMQLCKKAGGAAVPVSVDLFAVLRVSEEISNLSEGAFDVSIGPVVRLWRKARRTGELPSKEEIQTALDLVDYKKIELDPKGRTVRLLLVGMLLDLGGIAKGYAADAALEVLRQNGVTRALVAAGGDIAVSDAPPDAKGWRIGIAPLRDPAVPPSHNILLKNAAVSTSGDTHQFVEIDGKRYSHVVDPKTGLGLLGRRSVSVIAPKGVRADALDTAACVLGPEKGMRMLEQQEDVAAFFVFETEKGEESVATKSFAKYVLSEKNGP
ncbi:MAG: FAD:protein FMN transferase [Gemmataceae bacterium]|nr:FAD:protein FMN transferase [Gemmataceae bacterium]MCI0743613.1 FAD:protein FMN transferase [Gemmataceae bacterium]